MNDINFREITRMSLINECNNIVNSYMKVYDEYYSTGSRDSAFLKDLTDSLKGVGACLEVYTRDKHIHPSYAIEKLQYSKSIIDSCISFYESKMEE